jgi:hypothetical protein
MQPAIPALRLRQGEAGSTYPLAGKCVNTFVYRVLTNTNTGFLWRRLFTLSSHEGQSVGLSMGYLYER